MFALNEDNTIYATRGDIVFFSVDAEDDGVPYLFSPGDVVRIKIFGKKDCSNVVLQQDFPVTEESESVAIFLTKEDMSFAGTINKPTDYWYSVKLNPDTAPQTLIGYDEDGPVLFRVFPEGADLSQAAPEPEEIPVVDPELDVTSHNPVENQAAARAILQLEARIKDMEERYLSLQGEGGVQ